MAPDKSRLSRLNSPILAVFTPVTDAGKVRPSPEQFAFQPCWDDISLMLGVCGGVLAAGALPLPVEGRMGSRPSAAAASTTIRTSVRFVEIQRGVMVGANSNVENNVLICEE